MNQTHVEIKKYKMENLIKDFYCGLCSLQFGNRIVFDMHQSIVHGIVIKIRQERASDFKKQNKDRNENTPMSYL